MNILGKKTLIRAIEESDLPTLHLWANDPDIWQGLGGWHFPSSMDSLKQWFSGLKNDPLNQRFAVQALASGELIGTAGLTQIDWKNNHAYYGMMLGQSHRGQGFGTDITLAVSRYAFDELHFARLDTDIIEYNAHSLRMCLSSCGWQEEGRRRNWFYRQGRYWDQIAIGITREDYAAHIEKTKYWG